MWKGEPGAQIISTSGVCSEVITGGLLLENYGKHQRIEYTVFIVHTTQWTSSCRIFYVEHDQSMITYDAFPRRKLRNGGAFCSLSLLLVDQGSRDV